MLALTHKHYHFHMGVHKIVGFRHCHDNELGPFIKETLQYQARSTRLVSLASSGFLFTRVVDSVTLFC